MNRPETPGDQLRSIDLLFAFSLAADLAMGLAAGHGVRATYIGMRLADRLQLDLETRTDLFYAELLMDAGCTAWASQMAATILSNEITARRELFFFTDPRDPRDMIRWLARHLATGQGIGTRARRAADFGVHGKEFMQEGLRNTSEVAARIAGRLGRSTEVQDALRLAFENWAASGSRDDSAASTPLIARILFATIFLEVFHQVEGRDAAVRLARSKRGKTLDSNVVDAFLELASDEAFWRGLESESVWDEVRGMEPESPYRYLSEPRLDDVASAFADFADLKSFYSAGHSRRVAALVEAMAKRLGQDPLNVKQIRRAALMHDVGLVAVPSFVLHKSESALTPSEWELLRLHPYYAERILGRVPAFAPLIPLVVAHHERPDGRGFHRGISLGQIPPGACIIAVADAFDELTHAAPGRPALDLDSALRELAQGIGTRFTPACFDALIWAVGKESAPEIEQVEERDSSADPLRAAWPAGLTDREVDVLRLLSTGASRRDMAEELAVSEHTIRHHLEHIYGKIDVHTRVAATLFAIEHDLLN